MTKTYKSICIICHNEFLATNIGSKTCGNICNNKHRLNRIKNSRKKYFEKTPTKICKGCNLIFKNTSKRKLFCTRSCASKFYLKNGVYDTWRNHIQEKTGKYKFCLECNMQYYAFPGQIDTRKLCCKKCLYSYLSKKFTGDGSPSWGKKESQETKDKKINTLLKKYGIKNAYQLAKHAITSKPHLEIFNILKNEFQICEKEKNILTYRVDILFHDINVIIEYNGDYWHCNPKYYKPDYFHQKKQKFAKEIWEEDQRRFNDLQAEGYKIFVIWQDEYINDKEKTLSLIKEKIRHEKTQNINDLRPSVNTIADIKVGELLENSNIVSSHNVIENDKRDGLKIETIEQSAAKLLFRKDGESSETTVSLNESISYGNDPTAPTT
jgi:very-short-patch-repair endonuclease